MRQFPLNLFIPGSRELHFLNTEVKESMRSGCLRYVTAQVLARPSLTGVSRAFGFIPCNFPWDCFSSSSNRDRERKRERGIVRKKETPNQHNYVVAKLRDEHVVAVDLNNDRRDNTTIIFLRADSR